MRRHPFLVYTASRLLLFVAALGLLSLVGLRGVPLIGLAVLSSGLVSLWLLSDQRDALSVAVVERSRRVRAALEEGAAAEDEPDDDAVRADRGPDRPARADRGEDAAG